MTITNCGKRYVPKCPIIERLPDEWTYTGTVLDEHVSPFFGIEGKPGIACAEGRYIGQLFEEVVRCDRARKGMMGVLKDLEQK